MPRKKLAVPELHRFIFVGDTLKGWLRSKQLALIQGKSAGRYIISNDLGQWVINGTVNLDDAFAQIQPGEFVEIIYTGDTEAQSGFNVRQFDVYTGQEEEPKSEERVRPGSQRSKDKPEGGAAPAVGG